MRRCLSGLRSCAATRARSALAHIGLAEAASRADVDAVEREYFDLFIGLGRGELLPYGSYYLTGFLHERPLARLRADLSGSASSAPKVMPSRRITRQSYARSWRASSAAASGAGGADRELFEQHLAPWIGALLRRSGDAPTPPISIAESERSAGCSWISRRRHSRWRRRSGGDEDERKTRKEVRRCKTDGKAQVGRRDFLRALGAGAGARGRDRAAASPTEAHADTESNDEKRKARYKRDRRT